MLLALYVSTTFFQCNHAELSIYRSAGTSSLDPLPWFDFFSQELYLQNPHSTYTITHHVYLTPPTDQGPLFVCHHGAGASGLSFALFASEIRKALPRAGILAIDARGHGATSIEPSNAEDLDFSLPTLSQELLDVIILVQEKLSEPRIPDMVLIGHSLGGPVVVELVKSGKLGDAVLGYAVLDVVEGNLLISRLHRSHITQHEHSQHDSPAQVPLLMPYKKCKHIFQADLPRFPRFQPA